MKPRLAVLAALIVVSTACGNSGEEAATTTTTTSTTVPTTTTTTLPPGLPPGDDTTVSRVIDGDTIEVASGPPPVRLIGIDAPEVTGGCFANEATAHLAELLPVGMRVRLAYDVGRADRFGRTLAYVYRLTDGLFVNLALARDGFVSQLTVPPNVAHAQEFGAAVQEARSAGRGLWAVCRTTTTTRATTQTTRATTTTTASGGGGGGSYYANCAAARAAGAAPLNRGDPGYRAGLDRDGDGVACE